MTSEQFGAALVAFLIANAATLFAVGRWGIARAIKYTHLERDVKELQAYQVISDQRYEGILKDLKGISIKVDRKTGPQA